MLRSTLVLTLALAGLGAALKAEEARPLSPTVEAAAPAESPAQHRFALGVGYPDLRVRYSLGLVDVEAKAAFGSGIQVYTGRLYWNFYDLGPLKLNLGAEGGVVQFQDVQSLTGSGALAMGFLGLEYPFAGRLRLSLDAGPVWAQVGASDSSYSTTDWVYNAALYFYLF